MAAAEARAAVLDGVGRIFDISQECFDQQAPSAFGIFRWSIERAKGYPDLSLDDVIAGLPEKQEDKQRVLRFLTEYHDRKKLYRKEVSLLVTTLLQNPAWRAAGFDGACDDLSSKLRGIMIGSAVPSTELVSPDVDERSPSKDSVSSIPPLLPIGTAIANGITIEGIDEEDSHLVPQELVPPRSPAQERMNELRRHERATIRALEEFEKLGKPEEQRSSRESSGPVLAQAKPGEQAFDGFPLSVQVQIDSLSLALNDMKKEMNTLKKSVDTLKTSALSKMEKAMSEVLEGQEQWMASYHKDQNDITDKIASLEKTIAGNADNENLNLLVRIQRLEGALGSAWKTDSPRKGSSREGPIEQRLQNFLQDGSPAENLKAGDMDTAAIQERLREMLETSQLTRKQMEAFSDQERAARLFLENKLVAIERRLPDCLTRRVPEAAAHELRMSLGRDDPADGGGSSARFGLVEVRTRAAPTLPVTPDIGPELGSPSFAAATTIDTVPPAVITMSPGRGLSVDTPGWRDSRPGAFDIRSSVDRGLRSPSNPRRVPLESRTAIAQERCPRSPPAAHRDQVLSSRPSVTLSDRLSTAPTPSTPSAPGRSITPTVQVLKNVLARSQTTSCITSHLAPTGSLRVPVPQASLTPTGSLTVPASSVDGSLSVPVASPSQTVRATIGFRGLPATAVAGTLARSKSPVQHRLEVAALTKQATGASAVTSAAGLQPAPGSLRVPIVAQTRCQ